MNYTIFWISFLIYLLHFLNRADTFAQKSLHQIRESASVHDAVKTARRRKTFDIPVT